MLLDVVTVKMEDGLRYIGQIESWYGQRPSTAKCLQCRSCRVPLSAELFLMGHLAVAPGC